MSERQQEVLKMVIEEYVRTAEPISSKLLVQAGDFGVSPATLRAELQDLEEGGYLQQPHTSAGRVPTEKAYRFYVNSCVQQGKQPAAEARRRISTAVQESHNDPARLSKALADVLAALTDHLVITGIVERQDFFKRGLSALFENPEFQLFDNTFRLTRFFEEFEGLFEQMERELFAGEPINAFRITIGRENPMNDVANQTVMAAEYPLPGRLTGSIVIIGPMRMDYRRNVGLLNYTVEEIQKNTKH